MGIYGLLPIRARARSIKSAPKLISLTLLFILLFSGWGVAQETDGIATFAGGCFWCMQEPFDTLTGVERTVVGFSGGRTVNPSYREVTAGITGHYEVVQVHYDPDQVTYRQLVDIFWRNVDPLDGEGQFCDRGELYRTAIFTHNRDQRQVASASLRELNRSERFKNSIKTVILSYEAFYPAEEYHQNYYRTNSGRYKLYRYLCGRDTRLRELWGT